MTEQEQTLIRGCTRGDRGAWDSFVQQYSALVYHTINKTLTLHHRDCRDQQVEDLYQEFFISILQNNCRKLTQFRGDRGCSLASWLRLVASRLTIDFLRRQPPLTVEATDSFLSDQPAAADVLVNCETEAALAVGLAALSGRERLLIELHYRRGLAAEKVAAMLKISPGAFYTQKSRLLDKLRVVLAKSPSL